MAAHFEGTKIDVTALAFSKPKAHSSGSTVINVLHKPSMESLRITTPCMLSWGAQEGKDTATQALTGKFSLSLQFPSTDYANAEAEQFLDSMIKLEQQIHRDGIANSMSWFGKNITSMDVIAEKFGDMLRYPKIKNSQAKDYERPPCLSVKIPKWKDVWKPEIYDEDGQPLFTSAQTTDENGDPVTPLTFLPSRAHVMCLIECGGIWIANGKASITWNLKQAVVKRQQRAPEGTCLLAIKPTDKAAMNAASEEDGEEEGDDVGKGHDTTATLVDDSDNDEVEEYTTTSQPASQAEPVVARPPVLQEEATEDKKRKADAMEPTAAPAQPLTKKKQSTVIRKKADA